MIKHCARLADDNVLKSRNNIHKWNFAHTKKRPFTDCQSVPHYYLIKFFSLSLSQNDILPLIQIKNTTKSAILILSEKARLRSLEAFGAFAKGHTTERPPSVLCASQRILTGHNACCEARRGMTVLGVTIRSSICYQRPAYMRRSVDCHVEVDFACQQVRTAIVCCVWAEFISPHKFGSYSKSGNQYLQKGWDAMLPGSTLVLQLVTA